METDFDKVAEEYDFMARIYNNNDYFLGHMPRKRGSVLDLGCGSGVLCRALANYFDSITGIDVSKVMLSIAEKNEKCENIKYIEADAVSFTEGKYDFIVSRTTFHHISDIPALLESLKGMLNPEGRIVILDNVSKRETPGMYAYYLGAVIGFLPNVIEYGFKTAVRILRNSISKEWLMHLSKDKYLSEQGFYNVYGRSLPGAEFERNGCFMGVIWNKPSENQTNPSNHPTDNLTDLSSYPWDDLTVG